MPITARAQIVQKFDDPSVGQVVDVNQLSNVQKASVQDRCVWTDNSYQQSELEPAKSATLESICAGLADRNNQVPPAPVRAFAFFAKGILCEITAG